jgi:predicted Zn finger-like uncharacterized protein
MGVVKVWRTSAVLDMRAEIGDLDTEGAHASDSPAMILTCPDCATRYVVDDERIGPQGRAVRCAACGTRWTAMPDAPEAAAEPAVEPKPQLATEPEPASDPDFSQLAFEPKPLPADELPRAFRDKVHTQKRVRQAAATGAIWAGMLGVLALLIGAALVLRQDVARLWPRTAGAYAMVGLPVNLVGLAIESQHAQPALRDGHAAVVVTGALRNVLGRPVAAPPLRISLLNTAGKPVLVKIADPGGARIPPGEVRRFSVDVLDPPVSATDVEIAFVMDGKRPKGALSAAAPPLPAPSAPELRGPTSVTPITGAAVAQPEPSSSPYALPAAAVDNGGTGPAPAR